MADVGEGPRRRLILGKKEKNTEGKKKPSGQEKQNRTPTTPLAQDLDLPLPLLALSST